MRITEYANSFEDDYRAAEKEQRDLTLFHQSPRNLFEAEGEEQLSEEAQELLNKLDVTIPSFT